MNEEIQKNDKNNGNIVKTVIIVLLVIALLLCIGFIIYDKVISKDNNIDNTGNNNSNNTNDVVTFDLNSSEIQELTKVVRSLDGTVTFFGAEFLMNAIDLNNSNKNDDMMVFILSLSEPTWVCDAFDDSSDCASKCLVVDDEYYNGYVDAKDIENKFKEVFGPDVSYTNRTIISAGYCGWANTYDSKTKKYWGSNACGGGEPGIVYTELYKAEQKDDEIYTYWHFYNLEPRYIESTGEFEDYLLVKDVNNKEHEIPTDYTNAKDEINKIKTSIELKTYKITYKKQSDGNYYVYSGEWL
ncbi:MAG: hypothetical protein NC181_04655 [Clostridium sp.]|nr:hypothetical protein [Clostridium sp.]